MSKYRKNVQKKESTFNITNILIWGSVTVLALVFFYITFKPSPQYNLQTNCPTNETFLKKQGLTVVLIDLSDPLSAAQEEALKNEFISLTKSKGKKDNQRLLKKGDKLVVYLSNGQEVPDEIFNMCNPGTESEMSILNEQKTMVQAKWDNFSKNMIDKLVEQFVKKQEINRSPIIENIAYVRNKEFDRPEYIKNDKNKTNNFLIVSDMIQNSKIYNRYIEEKNYEDIYSIMPINLFGINVRVLQIINPKYRKYQNAELATWWRKYFAKAKGPAKIWSKL